MIELHAKKMQLGLATLALVVLVAGPSRAAAQGTLRYVAIGVSQYPKLPATQQLRFAHRDALELDQLWRTQVGSLWPQVDGQVLTDEHATLGSIEAAFDRLAVTAKSGDVAMVALCGHAGCCGRRSEWGFLPFDFDDADAAGTSLTASQLRARLIALARQGVTVVLILDCCNAGAFGIDNSDFAVFAACLPHEVSREHADWNNGLFTMALIEALQGKADFDGDGVVTLAEVDAYVSNRVAQVLRERAALMGGRPELQTPSCGRPTSIGSSLPLARVRPAGTHGKLLAGRPKGGLQ
jgi:uncharacterized caspase-like protein